MAKQDVDSPSGKTLFRDINAEEDVPEITEIESLCFSCMKQGVTRLFLTRIPFFKEVIISSFACEHCGYKNAEIQPGGRIQDKGVHYEFFIKNSQDLNRQIVQTKYCTISVPCLEFESPPSKGVLTTVEGIIDGAVDGLGQGQVLRKIQDPTVAEQIEVFIEKFKKLKELAEPFKMILDDPSGNSFVENPNAPSLDPEMKITHYNRSREQNVQLGLVSEDEPEEGVSSEPVPITGDEVVKFQANCPNCQAPAETNMKLVKIPHFKEVVIMATNCEACGYRDSEVKGGGAIEAKGRKIILKITDISDMSRDVLKSDTCSIAIPELDFETCMGTLGGKFTTVEGLLTDVQGQLKGDNPFFHGDSSQPDVVVKLNKFCGKLQQIVDGSLMGIHIVLDDPAGNSYIQNTYAPDPDPEMETVEYVRNFEQNEELGLNDMNTDNYTAS